MKTSNKILCTAAVIFLLGMMTVIGSFHKEYNKTKAYPQELLKQLADTKIRTLIVENTYVAMSPTDMYFVRQNNVGPIQYIAFETIPTPETAAIQGDTLRIKNHTHIFAQLRNLENYIVDGEPQPVPFKK